jgi:carbon storage regulator|tara:strand:+ start:555 stop:911 length:357 start_codon:yes stop_codon:yes gene_type:complete
MALIMPGWGKGSKHPAMNPVRKVTIFPFFGIDHVPQRRLLYFYRTRRDFYKEGIQMLVLSRKKNESVIIDDNIQVTIVEVRGDKVRLGINAPKDIVVHREEIAKKIEAKEASAVTADE